MVKGEVEAKQKRVAETTCGCFAWNQPSRVEHVRREGREPRERRSPVQLASKRSETVEAQLTDHRHRRHTGIATGDHGPILEEREGRGGGGKPDNCSLKSAGSAPSEGERDVDHPPRTTLSSLSPAPVRSTRAIRACRLLYYCSKEHAPR